MDANLKHYYIVLQKEFATNIWGQHGYEWLIYTTTDEVSRYFIDIPKGTTWEECKDKIKKKCIKSIREAVENSKKHG